MMPVDRFLKHIPEIESRIVELKPDALVFGMGPTGWLLPWIDQKILSGVRLWTCHDGCRIYPANDVVLMDGPNKGLHPFSDRYKAILESRPDRIWAYPLAWKGWKDHLAEPVKSICSMVHFSVWHPQAHPSTIKPKLDRMNGEPVLDERFHEVRDKKGHIVTNGKQVMRPDTCAISPTGTVTLAWALGARRIGVIGVDMLQEHGHTSWDARGQVDAFFTRIAIDAHQKGGRIANLSPVTSLRHFAEWKPSASSSGPINGSATPAQNSSLNTVCEQGLPAT